MNPEFASRMMISGLLNLGDILLNQSEDLRLAASTRSVTTPFSTTTQSDWADAVRLWNAHGRQLIVDLPPRGCPTCGNDNRRYLFDSYDGYPFAECNDCGCWFVPLMVDARLFEHFFKLCPEAWEIAKRSFTKRDSPENLKLDMERIGGYLDALLPLLPAVSPKRYLDMGCGLGHSLDAAKARGMQALGIESSNECISIGKVNERDIRPTAGIPSSETFQLITFWESLEHMADPAATLKKCGAMLEERGLLAFTVPNQHSPLVRTQRSDCSFVNGGYDTPGHINLFSPSNLSVLLERSGFVMLDLDAHYGLNLAELVSYLIGRNRGSRDLLQGEPVDHQLSNEVNAMMGQIGPAVALLERITHTAPILFGLACRNDSVTHFEELVRDYQAARTAKLQEEIKALMPNDGLAQIQAELSAAQEKLAASEQQIAALQHDLEIARNPLKRVAHFVRRKQDS